MRRTWSGIALTLLGVALVGWLLTPARDPGPPVPGQLTPDLADGGPPAFQLPASVAADEETLDVRPPLEFSDYALVADEWLAADRTAPPPLPEPRRPIVCCPLALPSPDPTPRPGLLTIVRREAPQVTHDRSAQDALKWLSLQQQPRGGWSFAAGPPAAPGDVAEPAGPRSSITGATGLAMLPFLAMGHTHKESKYKAILKQALDRLVAQRDQNLDADEPPGDLRGEGGDLLCQAWATLALCESYAQTQDKGLQEPAQQALDFLLDSQHAAGGWGPQPGQRGECLTTVWAIMALKSGHLAYLKLPPKAVASAIQFLNSIQSDEGAWYGSTRPEDGNLICTAGGLMCRMYLGWKRDNPALIRGLAGVSQHGPVANDAQFNLFVTESLWHMGGDAWRTWSGRMEGHLHATQVQRGTYAEEKGSWLTPDARGGPWTGRLSETALNALILLKRYDPRLSWHQRHAAQGDDF